MNYTSMSKTELLTRLNWKCKHGHNGIAHPGCYMAEQGVQERIAFLDTEFYVGKNNWGKLAGDWGFILCWVIGDGKGHYAKDCIRPKEVFSIQDKRIVASCIEELKKYDRVIHHYGDACDIPLLRTRAIEHKIAFPGYGQLMTTDLWKIAKSKLCLSSNSQKMISKLIYGKTEKTEVDPKIWLAAIRGNKKALGHILKHCEADVRDLERNAKGLLPFARRNNISI